MPPLTIYIPGNPNPYPGGGTFNWQPLTKQDNLVEGNETITVQLTSATGDIVLRPYGVPPEYISPSMTNRTLTIDDDPPLVTIEAADASATENAEGEETDPGQFIIHRTGGLISQPINVFYEAAGTATEGEDYEVLPGSVAVTDQAPISINVVDDPGAEGIESIQLTLTPDQQPQPVCYLLGHLTAAFVMLDDNVSVSKMLVTSLFEEDRFNGFYFEYEYEITGEHLEMVTWSEGGSESGYWTDYHNATHVIAQEFYVLSPELGPHSSSVLYLRNSFECYSGSVDAIDEQTLICTVFGMTYNRVLTGSDGKHHAWGAAWTITWTNENCSMGFPDHGITIAATDLVGVGSITNSAGILLLT